MTAQPRTFPIAHPNGDRVVMCRGGDCATCRPAPRPRVRVRSALSLPVVGR